MRLLILLLVAAVFAAPSQMRVRIAHTDESCDRQDLCRFVATLMEVIDRRDVSGLIDVTASKFNDDSSGRTHAELRKAASDPQSPFWAGLRNAVHLGGKLYDDDPQLYCGPSAYVNYPNLNEAMKLAGLAKSDDEPWVVISESAPIHSRPSADASVLATVGHELVVVLNYLYWFEDPESWAEVEHLDQRGYIHRKHLRSLDDPHFCFRLEDGAWRLAEFRDNIGRLR